MHGVLDLVYTLTATLAAFVAIVDAGHRIAARLVRTKE